MTESQSLQLVLFEFPFWPESTNPQPTFHSLHQTKRSS